jgi:hypothetical protein
MSHTPIIWQGNPCLVRTKSIDLRLILQLYIAQVYAFSLATKNKKSSISSWLKNRYDDVKNDVEILFTLRRNNYLGFELSYWGEERDEA